MAKIVLQNVGDGQFLPYNLPCVPQQTFLGMDWEDGFLVVVWVRNHRSSGVFTSG